MSSKPVKPKPLVAQAMRAMLQRRSTDATVASTSSGSAASLAEAYARLQAEHQALLQRAAQQQALIDSLQLATGVDTLTGLANRRSFTAELEKSLATARRHGRSHALVRVEVADYAPLTQQFGQATSELLLGHVARILRQNIRPTDIAGRLGQGDFVVILNELRAATHGPERAQAIADVLEATPCVLPQHTLSLTVFTACHVFGADDDLPELLAAMAQPCIAPTGTLS